jgi:hypothetical protein
MQQWSDGLRVFLFGFGGVFVGLILLMWAIQLSAFLIKIFSKGAKNK